MEVRTLWMKRRSSPPDESPELMVAWDEYSIDEYPEGFQEDVDKALASVADDGTQHRFITLVVSRRELDAAFEPARIEVAVETTEDV